MSRRHSLRLVRISLAGLVAMFLSACWNTENQLAGDATETGNAALYGRVVDGNGNGMPGVAVQACPLDFNPVTTALPDSLRTQTDAKGFYAFPKLGFNNYNVFMSRPESGLLALRTGLLFHNGSETLNADTLKLPGRIQIPLPDNSVALRGYVYIAGTPVHSPITLAAIAAGQLILDSVPAGTLPTLICNTDGTDAGVFVIDSGLAVTAGQQVSLPRTVLWKDSLTLQLNTSASGINLLDTLYDFPLAVRLQAPAFNFQHTLPGGADLRCFKPNGQTLSAEIEYWNPNQSEGLVWVRLDTLLPGKANQIVTLYYNNTSARATVLPPVFDTAAGFAGVWHLAEEIPDTVANGAYHDATQAGDNANDRISSVDQSGVLGYGHSFVDSDYLFVPSPQAILKPATAFTLSAWVKSSQPLNTEGEVLSMGDYYGLRVLDNGNAHAFYLPPLPADSIPDSSSSWVNVTGGGTTLRDDAWHLVTATMAADSLLLFMDGVEVAATKSLGPATYDKQLGNNFVMGKHGNNKPGFQFFGNLDEIEVHNRTRSKEWIRVTFANQKPGSQFPLQP